MTISIIIPIYNVEKYLNRCIKSVVEQSYSDLDIILVNDGSTDSSEQICMQYYEKDKRIKYYKKDNGGISSARNFGLNKAIGEYLMFVDADDFLEKNAINSLVEAISFSSAEIIQFSHIEHTGASSNVRFTKCCNMDYDSAIKNLLTKRAFVGFVWNKIYKTSLLNGLMFLEDVFYGEENFFLFSLLIRQKNIFIIEEPLYNYVRRDSSLTKSPFSNTKMTITKTFDYFERIYPSCFKHYFSYICAWLVTNLIELYDECSLSNLNLVAEKQFIVSEIKKHKYRSYSFCLSRKDKIKLFGITMLPHIYSCMLKKRV